MLKTIIALTVAAGFASAAFAQTGAPVPTPTNAPGVKVTVPAPTPVIAPVEKKMDAPKVDVTKAAEPVKADATKTAAPAKAEVAAKTEAVKADTKPAKPKHTSKTSVMPDVKSEAVAPTVK